MMRLMPLTLMPDAPDSASTELKEWTEYFTQTSLLELGMAAEAEKRRHIPAGSPVTFVIDRNVNYTNICNVDCMFCAFYRHADDDDAYVLPYEEIAKRAQALVDVDGTQFLLQGGVNPHLPFEYYTDLLRQLRADFPTLTLHAFSTSEISWMANITEKPYTWVLEQLIEAGLDSIPGAGAEILHDEVRSKVSPKKVNTDDWLGVMEAAHAVGLNTTASMMFGMTERPWHIVDHLLRIRDLQANSLEKGKGKFTAFIPWTFQPDNTQLQNLPVETQATGSDFLRVIALSRLILNNVEHIQSSWLTQGMKLCQSALNFGADDFGGLVLEENVVTEAGVTWKEQSVEYAVSMIHDAGFDAAQRNTAFDVLKRYPKGNS